MKKDLKSIHEVLEEMDRIVEVCRKRSMRAGYFAVLYRMVTHRIHQEIEAGEFEDNERMEQLDVLFAKRYIEAFDAWINGRPLTRSWRTSFESAESDALVVMQHLLTGINAHINLDLGIAASETMKGEPISGLKEDFDRINAILYAMTERVKQNIGKVSPLFRLLVWIARGRDEMVLNFSIRLARDGAWEFAMRYHHSHEKEGLISRRDIVIAALADRIVYPGPLLKRVLRVVRVGEYKSTGSVMDTLERICGDGN